MIWPKRRPIIAAIAERARLIVQHQTPTSEDQAKRAVRQARDVRTEIAKSPDLRRVERKIDLLLERRSFGEPQET